MMVDRMSSCRCWTTYWSVIHRRHHSQLQWFTAQGSQLRHGRQTLLDMRRLPSRWVSSLARRSFPGDSCQASNWVIFFGQLAAHMYRAPWKENEKGCHVAHQDL